MMGSSKIVSPSAVILKGQTDVPIEVREFARQELKAIAEILHTKFGMKISDIPKFLQEMITVSV